MDDLENVKRNLRQVLSKIEQATQRRSPELRNVDVRLMAASKIKSAEHVLQAYEAGQRDFGENYVQELEEKANHPIIIKQCTDIRWHFIGHLQSNKINKLLNVPNLYMVQTVHSKKLATALNDNFQRLGNKDYLKVMVQINTSGEEAKSGVPPPEATSLTEFVIKECPNLQFDGLMTIGKYGYNPAEGPNPDFLCLKKCRKEVCQNLSLNWKTVNLSMGMSTDYEQAVELGSTYVRVGVAIFGERPPNWHKTITKDS